MCSARAHTMGTTGLRELPDSTRDRWRLQSISFEEREAIAIALNESRKKGAKVPGHKQNPQHDTPRRHDDGAKGPYARRLVPCDCAATGRRRRAARPAGP